MSSGNQPKKIVADEVLNKNRLQEYAQRAGIALPIYFTVSEGSANLPKFQSTVTVGGRTYRSPSTFSTKKAAEQHIAKYALEAISPNTNNWVSIALNNNVFCKSILNEYAVKMNIELPKYEMFQLEGNPPTFVASVCFDKKVYTGHVGKSKKEAEQLGARVIIDCILGSDTKIEMSRIIRSKGNLCAELFSVNETSSTQAANMPLGLTNPRSCAVSSGDGKQLVHVSETGNSLAAAQPMSVSFESPSSDPVNQNSKRRKKNKGRGQSPSKKLCDELRPQSGLVSSKAPKSSTSNQELSSTELPKPITIHQEVPPTGSSPASTVMQVVRPSTVNNEFSSTDVLKPLTIHQEVPPTGSSPPSTMMQVVLPSPTIYQDSTDMLKPLTTHQEVPPTGSSATSTVIHGGVVRPASTVI